MRLPNILLAFLAATFVTAAPAPDPQFFNWWTWPSVPTRTTTGSTGSAPTNPPSGTGSGTGGSSSGVQPGTSSCPSIEIISARGTGEPQSGSLGMAPIFSAIQSAISPYTQSIYNVVYPASADFFSSPAIGASDLQSHIQSQITKCPNQKFVLAGYSQGAMVIVQGMNKITSLADKVVACILFGDPYFDSSSPAAYGTAKGSGTSGGFGIAGYSIPSVFVGKTRDYCDAGDGVCVTHSFTITAAHLGYGSKYASDAAQFVASRLK
ncbi:hypothetical protein HDV00_002981 [Rhizophlyctis rosea]|nr:hypothetical protein HDV00_002981 [Rhizophlyctis rosea]